jgi:hypothetical protein
MQSYMEFVSVNILKHRDDGKLVINRSKSDTSSGEKALINFHIGESVNRLSIKMYCTYAYVIFIMKNRHIAAEK